MNIRLCICGLMLTLAEALAAAQSQPAPASAPAADAALAAAPLVVTVREVAGPAQYLTGAGGAWADLKAGQQLGEETIIRTGFGGRVVLAFADNSEVVVDRATKMGISQFRREGGTTRTTLGVKYGSLSAEVHRAAGPNDFRVATPVATAAVAGTSGDTGYSADYGFALSGWTGVWQVRHGRDRRSIHAGEQADDELTNPVYLKELHGTVQLGDTSGGMVNTELYILREYGNGRGYLDITGPAGSGGFTGLSGPTSRPSKHDGGGDNYTPPGADRVSR